MSGITSAQTRATPWASVRPGRLDVTVLLTLVACWLATTQAIDPGWLGAGAAASAGMVAHVALLAAVPLLCLMMELEGATATRWLMVGAGLILTQGFLLSLPTRSAAITRHWVLIADSGATLALVLVVVASVLAPTAPGAVSAGLASIAVVAITHTFVRPHAGPLPAPPAAAVIALLLGTGALIAVQLCRASTAPTAVRWSLALAAVALAVHRGVVDSGLADGPWWAGVGVATAILGAAIPSATALSMVQDQVTVLRRDRVAARETVALRREVQTAREQLHEVRGTIASIMAASGILEDGTELADETRRQLSDLLTHEAARLHRLLEATPDSATAFDLDEAIRPVILAHRASGHVVHWDPCGWKVFARPDDLAQVVRILLDNAAMHAPGATVWVSTVVADGWLELAVTDDGPGLPPELGNAVFDSGVRGPESRGSGIGLHVAARLMAAADGYLRHERPVGGGAAFLIGLPEMGLADDTGPWIGPGGTGR